MNTRERVRFHLRAAKYRLKLNPMELAQLGQWLRRGELALDVGAHKGGMLYWLRRCVGRSGAVIAFEPQPALAGYLRQVVSALKWTNVTVEQAAVGSVAGPTQLFVPGALGRTSPGASLTPKESGAQHAVTVPGIVLDSYLPPAAGRHVAFIKCDCEGHELDVFRGGERLLRRDRPTLLFECEARHLRGARPEDVFDFLHELGYRGHIFTRAGLVPVERFRVDVHQRRGDGQFWGSPDYVNSFLFRPETVSGG